MDNKEFINFLKKHRDDPRLGGGFRADEIWNNFVEKNPDLGFQKHDASFHLLWRDYANYFVHVSSKTMLRPVSVAFSAFVLVFGGWVAAVNTSFASVPGDFLYPVKLATERVQLTLAASNEQRARLHTEFASRRVDEVVEITSSSREGKEIRVQKAMESFKQSIELANQAVGDLVVSSPETAASVAIAIDQKVEAMASTLSVSGETSVSEGHGEQISEAQNTAEASDQFLTETIVASNETVQKNSTDVYLQDTFKKDMVEIQNRAAALSARLVVVEAAMRAGRAPYDYSKSIIIIKGMIKSSDDQLQEAMEYFAAGGWRRVLEVVTGLKTKLSNAEVLVLQMEIEISTNNVGQ